MLLSMPSSPLVLPSQWLEENDRLMFMKLGFLDKSTTISQITFQNSRLGKQLRKVCHMNVSFQHCHNWHRLDRLPSCARTSKRRPQGHLVRQRKRDTVGSLWTFWNPTAPRTSSSSIKQNSRQFPSIVRQICSGISRSSRGP